MLMFDEKLFRAQMLVAGVTISDIAKALNINETTVYRKINNDGSFSRDEIQKLCKVLKITTFETLNRIFFATELAETQEKEVEG